MGRWDFLLEEMVVDKYLFLKGINFLSFSIKNFSCNEIIYFILIVHMFIMVDKSSYCFVTYLRTLYCIT